MLSVVASRRRFGMVSLVARVIGRRHKGRKEERKKERVGTWYDVQVL